MSRGPKDGDPALRAPRAGTSTRTEVATTSSAEHRRKLEAMFSGGAKVGTSESKPKPRGDKVFSSPRKSIGRGPSEYRLRLERLRMAREPEEIEQATDAFLEFHQLPDDADILFKVLQHPSEKVVRDALGQISALLMQNRFGGTLMLKEQLNGLAERVTEDATRSYIDGIRAQIAQLDAS